MEQKFTPKQFADQAAALLRMHLKYDTQADGAMGAPKVNRAITPHVHRSGDLGLSTKDLYTFTAEQCSDFLSPHMQRVAETIRNQHRDGFVFAALEIPGGLQWAEGGESGPVPVRLCRGYDISNNSCYTIIDVLVFDFTRFVAITL